MQTTRRNLLVGTGLGLAGLAVAEPAMAYSPAPTNGKGGTFDNKDALGFTDSRGVFSRYHLRAAGLSGTQARPLVVHLHGDGGYEYRNPNTWTTPLYRDAARAYGGVFVVPKTTYEANGYTWWRSYSSTQWLADFIRFLGRYYNIDRRRIYISGFSGGAQTASYNLVADYHSLFLGGGAMMLGGGGTSGMAITGTPSAAVKADFLMRWHVGDRDVAANSPERFDAVQAANIGRDTYARAGWNTRLTYIPGEDHNQSEDDGPAALRSLLAESHQRYGL